MSSLKENLKQKMLKMLFTHKGMSQVMVHDDCGGWLAEIESCCGIQLKCSKCGKVYENYWHMGEQPNYHLEWHSTEEVNKFYGE
jgi:phage FluMu protein Com